VAPGPWETILAGSFKMGSPPNEPCRGAPTDGGYFVGQETQHKVTLTRAFEINVLEVKQHQWAAVMGYSTSAHTAPTLPAHSLSWHEAVAYCNQLSIKSGLETCYDDLGSGDHCVYALSTKCTKDEVCMVDLKRCVRYAPGPAFSGAAIYGCRGYRLPTEAEWEYAYRAGSTSAYYNKKTSSLAACKFCFPKDLNLDLIAWYCGNQHTLQPGGPPKQPNAWGLYDMAGNAYEWCHDGWVKDLGSATVTDPVSPVQGEYRVKRGGAYYSSASRVRAACRAIERAKAYSEVEGVRCVRSLPKSDAGP
jgi:sulfatase modifying factor 1